MASLDSLPQCVRECWELLHSEAFFLLLSNFTGLRLHYLCPNDDEDDEGKDRSEEAEGMKEREDAQAGEASGSSVESSSGDAARRKGVCSSHHPDCVPVCVFHLSLSRRTEHPRMLRRAASLVPRRLHPVA